MSGHGSPVDTPIDCSDLRVAVVASSWHAEVMDGLVAGAQRAMDAYQVDADGYYWYQARTDDMIISAGYNIAGPEVEDVLLQHPAVAECGVVGAPDPERGQVVLAYVVLRPGEQCGLEMAKALQDHVKAAIAPYKYPRRIEFRTALPRTETGKLQRFKLRQEARQNMEQA